MTLTPDFEAMVEKGARARLGHHCTTCGGSVNDSGKCRSCGGIACRADKRDPVAPDPPCYGCKAIAERVLTAAGVPNLLAENARLRDHVEIGTRCLADIVSNGHRRTGPACAGFALTALNRMGALTTDEDALDTQEGPALAKLEGAHDD